MTAAINDPLTVSVPELDPAALHGSLSTTWGLEGELTAVHGERDRNFRIDAPSGRYLLKVHNPADGEGVLDLQYSALRHIRTVAPDVPVPDVLPLDLPSTKDHGASGRWSAGPRQRALALHARHTTAIDRLTWPGAFTGCR
ncbi:MAG: hypothetical protein ABI873_16640 [Marmoricola sp.]